jgi:beta-phosphoglucomutase-like phosphatase (HAD superfamily)
MRPDLVVWDCDGVLVDTERLVTRLESEWITELGWTLTPDDVVEHFMGRSEAHMAAEIERELGSRSLRVGRTRSERPRMSSSGRS